MSTFACMYNVVYTCTHFSTGIVLQSVKKQKSRERERESALERDSEREREMFSTLMKSNNLQFNITRTLFIYNDHKPPLVTNL